MPSVGALNRQFHRLREKVPLFRIFYSGTFFITAVVLAALLLITPGDHIYQSFRHRQLYSIIIVAAVYVLTILVAIFIYASRQFKTRSALASIPRTLHLGDGTGKDGSHKIGQRGRYRDRGSASMILGAKVNRQVRAVVRNGLNRSAIIAYEARPRDLMKETRSVREIPALLQRSNRPEGDQLSDSQSQEDWKRTIEPTWGFVAHPGWSSPCSPDLPNLHYEQVIVELPNLIEAKAVSLAPVEPNEDLPTSELNQGDQGDNKESEAPALDSVMVDHLTRPAAMTLRDYISHLTSLEMLDRSEAAIAFTDMYERARFSGQPLTELEFRTLMNLFAELLRQMRPLTDTMAEQIRDVELRSDTEDVSHSSDDGARNDDNESTASVVRHSSLLIPDMDHFTDEEANTKQAEKLEMGATPQPPTPTPSTSRGQRQQRQQQGDPVTPRRRRRRGSDISSSSSFIPGSRRTADTASISTAGSVIRLTEAKESLDLPYAFVTDSASSREV